MQQPIISIIIPVYNAENYLKRCLESVIHQTYKELDIIMVNDGSTDQSPNICDKYASIDSRIKVIHKKNRGVSNARNVGLNIAKGDYIHFVDADDWLEENTYLTLVKEVNSSEKIDIIKFNAYNSQKQVIGQCPFTGLFIDTDLEKLTLQYIGSEKFGGTFILGVPWLYLIRKNLIEKNLIRFNEQLHRCEDRLFVISNFLYAKKVLFIDKVLYNYETSSSSLSNKFDKERWAQEKKYLSLLKDEYEKNRNKEYTIKANHRIKNDIILRSIMSINNIYFSKNKNAFIQNYNLTKDIVKDPLIIDSFNNFESGKLDLKSRIIVTLIKQKQALLLTLLNTMLLYKTKLLNNG